MLQSAIGVVNSLGLRLTALRDTTRLASPRSDFRAFASIAKRTTTTTPTSDFTGFNGLDDHFVGHFFGNTGISRLHSRNSLLERHRISTFSLDQIRHNFLYHFELLL
jgi:hypothetical protein